MEGDNETLDEVRQQTQWNASAEVERLMKNYREADRQSDIIRTKIEEARLSLVHSPDWDVRVPAKRS